MFVLITTFPSLGIFKSLKDKTSGACGKDQEVLAIPFEVCDFINPKNPFLKENMEEKYSTLDAAMEALTVFTVKRNMSM